MSDINVSNSQSAANREASIEPNVNCVSNPSNPLAEADSNLASASQENQACPKKKGSKFEVYHGQAIKTGGNLTKDQLMMNKKGKIISKRKHEQGKKALENIRKGFESESKEEKPKQVEVKPMEVQPLEDIQEEEEKKEPRKRQRNPLRRKPGESLFKSS